MKLLLKAALTNRKHYILLIVTFFSMISLTIASQTEMFALGVIAKASPADMFTLFAPDKEGKVEHVDQLSLSEVEKGWNAVAPSPGAPITREAANSFVLKRKGTNLVQTISAFLDKHFSLSDHLVRLALFLVVVAVFKAASLFSYRYITKLVAIRVSRDLRQNYFEHIQKLPMSFYHKYDTGSLTSRVSGDAGAIANAVNSLLINYFQTPVSVVATLIACFYISWQLSLVIFIGFPVVVFPIIYIAKRIKLIAKQMQRNQEGFASTLIEFLSGIMTVKIFGMEKFSLKKYQEHNHKMAKLEERSSRYGLSSRPILHTIASLFFATVILYGIYVVDMGVAELLVFCGLLYVFYEPIKKFAEENNNIFRGVAAAERMYEVLNETATVEDDPRALPLKTFNDSIVFENVSFKYNHDWVLKNLSFTVKKGETVAIVGPTGAGKSTIAKLLPRLYDAQEGTILIDGKPITDYQRSSVRAMIGFVPQKPFLFIDSVRQNIAFGQNFSLDAIKEAAQKAHAEEFIVDLPNQYDAMVSERGKNLSGGQQQRLAIARALVKEAPILVMDEATSSLDAVSEGKIKEALLGLKKEVTQIIIAHRFSTIEHADKIIYLEQGKKVAEGTRQDLLQTCPNFRLMWEMMHQTHTAGALTP